MNTNKIVDGKKVTVVVEGRLDTNTAPLLENEITDIEKYEKLFFDFKDLEYISSSGLRVILTAQKRMNKVNGTMVIKNVNQTVREVFEITGFFDIITVE